MEPERCYLLVFLSLYEMFGKDLNLIKDGLPCCLACYSYAQVSVINY